MSMEIDSPEFTRQFVDRYIPLDRPGRVEDVAPAFLFLASDESRFMTGQVLILDGGQLAGQKPGTRPGKPHENGFLTDRAGTYP
jgi:NAD(P)-dependent dehydrogenase (short-subunit alcohol dehydrogenase family)